jgi:hypothetical protein
MAAETQLANEIEQLLLAVIEIQEELALLYRAKREAIRKANAAEIDRLSQREERVVSNLQARLRHREQILQRVSATMGPVASLEKLVPTCAEPEQSRLLALFEKSRRLVESNRRESWVLWIVSKQSLRLFRDVLDMIANGGKKAPVYFAGSGTETSFGGAILDASA